MLPQRGTRHLNAGWKRPAPLTSSQRCVTLGASYNRSTVSTVQIKKAIITAAGKAQRTLPLQTVVDRDGIQKTALRIIIEEILDAGVEEIGVVVCPGDQSAYASAAGNHARRIEFFEQSAPLGYGHAVWCVNSFTADQPFLLLVGDHLYVSRVEQRCAQQLVEIAAAENCAASAVQATHEGKLPYYGAVGGKLVTGREGLYEIAEVLEKPTPTEAEQRLIVPGLRAGHYLCFFGMHVLTPAVMDILADEVAKRGAQGNVQLTAALAKLAARERYLACELHGRRYDIGVKYGLLTAQLALALAGRDRDEVLSGLVELLAHREKPANEVIA
jgi:UTP--glucose-1-phosphate uridylyltransferase